MCYCIHVYYKRAKDSSGTQTSHGGSPPCFAICPSRHRRCLIEFHLLAACALVVTTAGGNSECENAAALHDIWSTYAKLRAGDGRSLPRDPSARCGVRSSLWRCSFPSACTATRTRPNKAPRAAYVERIAGCLIYTLLACSVPDKPVKWKPSIQATLSLGVRGVHEMFEMEGIPARLTFLR